MASLVALRRRAGGAVWSHAVRSRYIDDHCRFIGAAVVVIDARLLDQAAGALLRGPRSLSWG